MKVNLQPDFPVTNDAAKEATGKTLDQWFAELDAAEGLKIGRRECNQYLVKAGVEPWWCTTISVEYEAHHKKTEKDGKLKGYFICSTKTIAAPVERIYAAWTTSADLDQWLGAGSKINLTEGGTYENADGNKAEFKRIRQNKDLRFTWKAGDDSLVDMSVQDKGNGKTYLLVNHDRIQTRAEADGLRAAWANAIDQLKKLVE
ncbi:MAG: hypothetical protein BGO01_01885 [Armatimonadetes bacterium 55-13]|nr:SRPBCC domain-containing protein [Armatimonadota bacterium]OJU65685.1 MAG: hypothetical protein BGO01_01885 [Armatimonadetes bacterium 55-13]